MIEDEVIDIVDLMFDYETFTITNMASALNTNRVSVRNAVNELIRKGRISRRGSGNKIEYMVLPKDIDLSFSASGAL